MSIKKEINRLDNLIAEMKSDLRESKFERLDFLIAEMKSAAKEMLAASRAINGKELPTEQPIDNKGSLRDAIERGEFADLTQEQLSTLQDAVEAGMK